MHFHKRLSSLYCCFFGLNNKSKEGWRSKIIVKVEVLIICERREWKKLVNCCTEN